jgi:hypothetical protein
LFIEKFAPIRSVCEHPDAQNIEQVQVFFNRLLIQ